MLSLNVSIKCKKSQVVEDEISFVKLSNFIQKNAIFEVSEATQAEIRTAETLVPQPNASEVQMDTGKLKT
jgi:hypothetical protein